MKLFVWDLHGTLEIGNEIAVIELSNRALKHHGYKQRFSKSDIRYLYGIKWHDYYAHLLPDAERRVHMQLHKTAIELAEKDLSWLKQIELSRYASSVLKKIAARHEQILISNTLDKHLKKYVTALSLDKYFSSDRVFSAVKFAGDRTSKVDILHKYTRGKKFDNVIAIGDRATDMEIAKAVDGIGYLYAHPGWQHQPAEADYRIHDLRKVLAEI